jgi:4-diphosphocytidyl-2-C-methyl-D-erythritol kinase
VSEQNATRLAPAKINLMLRVLEREPTGYHQIETVFQRLALSDAVTLRVTPGKKTLALQWDGPRAADLGKPEDNLAWKAAAAYEEAAGWPGGWSISITKRIPAGTGLGGGSADAGAVLRILDQMATEPLGLPRLLGIAATIGADVPFLTTDHILAIGRGRGERLRGVPGLPPTSVVIGIPPFGISTAEAYAALAGDRTVRTRGVRASIIRNDDDFSSWEAIGQRQVNDFEQIAFAAHPELATFRDTLHERGAVIARLCGSGAGVFGLWSSEEEAPTIPTPRGWRLVRTTTA